MVENRTADIIQETKKLQIRRKGGISNSQIVDSSLGEPMSPAEQESQLKASRDVRCPPLCWSELQCGPIFYYYFNIFLFDIKNSVSLLMVSGKLASV